MAVARGVGWAYYLLAEGYNAIGWLGVLYNALVWNLGMLIWSRFASSNNEKANFALNAIMSMLIINVMRSQSFLFIRYLWLFIVPCFLILL